MKEILHKLLSQYADHFHDTPFQVDFWDGDSRHYGDGQPVFTLCLNSKEGIKSALRNGALGMAEAYMDGEIDIDGNLQAFLKFESAPLYERMKLSLREKIKFAVSLLITRNTVRGAKKNVKHHYDLGNDFYQLWLDPSMTYTCAYFTRYGDTLAQAQNNKHEHICRKLRLEPGMTLVDIGCGWGAMLVYAAQRYGVIGVGYTISEEQAKWAKENIKRLGLEDRITIELKDYREAEGQFDRWVSIGMFEQIGKSFFDMFFSEITRILKPGGIGVLHTIGSSEPYTNNPWIEKYIFPGGHLPQLGDLVDGMNGINLNPIDVEDLRLHYGQTLDSWYANFNRVENTVWEMYGERFVRMWRFYLNGAAQGFKWGTLRLYQIVFSHGLDQSQPRTREYLYHSGHVGEQFNEVAYGHKPEIVEA
jgi:cyclopropane-fatty-acyl-phospholipid synthase